MPVVPTRLDFETELHTRVGGLIYFVYVKAWDAGRGPAPSIAPTGFNRVYNGAIGWAMDLVGTAPDSPALVTDADLVKISTYNYPITQDLAEYRMIANALGNYVQPDTAASGRSQAWGSLRAQFQDRLKSLEAMYRAYLKGTRYTLGYGTIPLQIAPPGDEYCGGFR